jgi:methyl-accepting chemotaxis protein
VNLLTRLRIGPRLAVAFAALLLAAAGVVLYGISRLSNVTDSLTLIGEDRIPKVQKLTDVTDNINLIARELRNTLIWSEPAQVAGALDASNKAREDVAKTLEQLQPTLTSEAGKKLFAELQAARGVYVPVQTAFMELVRAGKKPEAQALLTDKLRPAQLNYFKAVDTLKEYQIGLVSKAVDDGKKAYETDKAILFSLLVLMVAVSAVFGWFIARSIVKPLQRAVGSAGRIAEGNLREVITAEGRDETTELLQAVSRMQASLRTVVGQVRTGVDSVTTASAQIAAGNQDLSSRTEEQASSLQQTASSMEQLTGTVNQSSENARQANQLAQSASQAASKGGEVVREVVGTMEQISASSKRIADIIGTIDGIAFQTNILALNAAVEAARAGEQGRGFAVVASEVRSLAQRSAQAAKEIKSLITDSEEKVGAGGRLVVQAGTVMDDIVNQVRRVTDLVGEITSASAEQSQGIGQINDAVTQMDQVTQQNAALVEESAAAAASLSQQAQKLAEVVAVFQIDDSAVRAPATPAAAAPAAGSKAGAWSGADRRGPDRATNVQRPAFGAKPAAPAAAVPAKASAAPAAAPAAAQAAPAATGTDDWTSF